MDVPASLAAIRAGALVLAVEARGWEPVAKAEGAPISRVLDAVDVLSAYGLPEHDGEVPATVPRAAEFVRLEVAKLAGSDLPDEVASALVGLHAAAGDALAAVPRADVGGLEVVVERLGSKSAAGGVTPAKGYAGDLAVLMAGEGDVVHWAGDVLVTGATSPAHAQAIAKSAAPGVAAPVDTTKALAGMTAEARRAVFEVAKKIQGLKADVATAPGYPSWDACMAAQKADGKTEAEAIAVCGTKAPDAPKVEARHVRVVKADPGASEQRYVLGVVLEPETPDAQGHVYAADVVEKAAHQWMEHYRHLGIQHTTLANEKMAILESYILRVTDETMGCKVGTWLLAVRVLDDALWADIKAGKVTGFSVGGYAEIVSEP